MTMHTPRCEQRRCAAAIQCPDSLEPNSKMVQLCNLRQTCIFTRLSSRHSDKQVSMTG